MVSEAPQEVGHTKVDLSPLYLQQNGRLEWGSRENFPEESGRVKKDWRLVFRRRQCQTGSSAPLLTLQQPGGLPDLCTLMTSFSVSDDSSGPAASPGRVRQKAAHPESPHPVWIPALLVTKKPLTPLTPGLSSRLSISCRRAGADPSSHWASRTVPGA